MALSLKKLSFLRVLQKRQLQKKIGPNIVSARMETHALEIFHRPSKLEWRLFLKEQNWLIFIDKYIKNLRNIFIIIRNNHFP